MNAIGSDRLVEFIVTNDKVWAKEPSEKLCGYLQWHNERGLLAVSLMGDEVYGLCTVRFFSRLDDWLMPWAFDPLGAFCMVDLLVAVSPLAIAECFQQLVRRWNPRPIVLWERRERTDKTDGPPRMYRWDQYLVLLRRLTYGTINL